jgi:hypothetical protein
LLKSLDGSPTILANQIFFLFDVRPHLDTITNNMTVENVLVAVGTILRSKQRLHEDVTAWARNLFDQAGLPFVGNSASGGMERDECATDPPSGLSVVPSQSATPKTEVQPPSPKRKSRRVYLDLAVKLLEKGSCTHRALVDAIMEQHPGLNRETVSTFVSDVQNPRYSPIKGRNVVKLPPDGRLVFEDRIKPVLTVIENPTFAGVGKNGAEPITDIEKQANFSKGDV